jgi:hypothetical protein
VALLYPISNSTFGDSRETAGAHGLCKYILAQYQSDADFEWVKRLRAHLNRDELKYRDFHPLHRQIKSSNPELYNEIETGIAQATVIVIDPAPIASDARAWLDSEHAEPEVDYTEGDVLDVCAMSLLAGTPIAYLPERLDLFGTLQPSIPSVKLSGFAPLNLLQKVGGLNGAKVLAARAHAMFDVENRHRIGLVSADVLLSPLREVVLREILSTARIFDTENQSSVKVLNEAADVIASSMRESKWFENIRARELLVREFNSRGVDLIQAADMAAGWAGDMLEYQEVRTLGSTFRRVIVNGQKL